MSKNNLLRLFIAIEIPGELQNRIKSLQDEIRGLQNWIRIVAPKNIHFTLKFLGDTKQDLVIPISKSLDQISLPSIPITIQGVGCFPNKRRPRVIWLGIQNPDGVTAISQLAKAIDSNLNSLGIAREKRSFRPHTTIARIKRPISIHSNEGRDVQDFLESNQDRNIGSFSATRYQLKQSTLTPQGPIYKTLSEHVLQ